MKRTLRLLAIALVAGLSTAAGSAVAQKPLEAAAATTPELSPGEATPEMWFYQQQLHRHDNPKVAVRAKAEQEAAQRENRIAAMKWFGFSNQRPNVSTDPYGTYSPMWVGNSYDPAKWRGTNGLAPVNAVPVDIRRY